MSKATEALRSSIGSTVLSSDDSGTQTIESLLMDNALATVALAEEQRTANLIAVLDHLADPEQYEKTVAQLTARLDLK